MVGAGWQAHQLYHIGQTTTSACPLCGQPEVDSRHGLWHCVPVQQRHLANASDEESDAARISGGRTTPRRTARIGGEEIARLSGDHPTTQTSQPPTDLHQLDPNDLPTALQIGLPPPLTNRMATTFWNTAP